MVWRVVLPMTESKQSVRSGTRIEIPVRLPCDCTAGGKNGGKTGGRAGMPLRSAQRECRPARADRARRANGAAHAIGRPSDGRQTAITVTDFVTRYGSSASGPPSEP